MPKGVDQPTRMQIEALTTFGFETPTGKQALFDLCTADVFVVWVYFTSYLYCLLFPS